MSYKVKLNIFQGPLDLLLFLIKRDKIDIYDIPISKVTEQYMEYTDLLKLLDLEIAGEFLVMAATLMHIKSKMLLPPDEEDSEEAEEEDPREELVRRLLEYKKFKDAASNLQQMHDDHKGVFLRKGAGDKEKIISGDGTEYFEASLFDLIIAFKKVLKEVPKETFHKVVRNKFTVSDKIHEIYHLLAKQSKIQFLSLFTSARDKDEVIVTFLAILELMKMREIFVGQKDFFGEIEIVRNPELVKNS
ncbi:MAG: segregation/condensation protein A [Candidatus Omnitrophica bacterium]|nr:segregation/condensation protein A [Candidatus Omnitrophota bacterium]